MESMKGTFKRNFSIIAHIDHGKSTISDRILEYTNSLTERELKGQFLDKMDLEQERGITIKAQAVSIKYNANDGNQYTFNFIDTPGHVDFAYEVSRSLIGCEGALLVVDAAQGVEAQTVANIYLAIENDLELIPVLNKIDLPSADTEKVMFEIEEVGVDTDNAVFTSAKTGLGIEELMEAIVKYIPAPDIFPNKPLKALIFDAWFDSYRGVVLLVRIFEGSLKKGTKLHFMHRDVKYETIEVGVFNPHMTPLDKLESGDVGYIIAGIKTIKDIFVGDTITDIDNPTEKPLEGFKEPEQMVFSGIFPVEGKSYESLKESLENLSLNDASFTYEPETSDALGFGFRCGFLGLLHMEIIQERLEREYDLDIITTVPNVIYHVILKKDEELLVIDNPSDLPSVQYIDHIEEPYVKAQIMTPETYVGNILKLAMDRRGIQEGMEYLSTDRVVLSFSMPLSEIIFDFFDKLKSVSRGYASLEYELSEYKKSNLEKIDILINGDKVDALSFITHRDNSFYRGREVTRKLKEVIPRQMYEVAVQAAIGTRVIARTTVKAFRKNVTAKCYGGDISRKRKLLQKQKAGKKRMKQVGNVEIPQEAFLAVLKLDD